MAKATGEDGRESGTGQDTPLGVCPCPAPLPATPCGTWRDIVPSCPAVTYRRSWKANDGDQVFLASRRSCLPRSARAWRS